jgi:hypothetical protein
MFRYRLGQRVRWAEFPADVQVIVQRRWTQRQIPGPIVEYRLADVARKPESVAVWVYEADIEAWPDTPPSR